MEHKQEILEFIIVAVLMILGLFIGTLIIIEGMYRIGNFMDKRYFDHQQYVESLKQNITNKDE